MESIESASNLSSNFVEEVHARKIIQELWKQCKSEEFCDVVLIAGTAEKRIPAHSCILSAASKYFKGLLSPSTEIEIKISSVDGDVMQSLVKYCYTGRITVTEDIIVKLLENTDEPILTDVLPACANFLVEQLHPSNCLGFMLLAEQYGCETLLQKARDYSLEHFLQLQETTEFLRLNVKQLKELLAWDNLNVSSEENVFNSLLAWIRHDSNEREKYQAELLKVVRLPLLGKSFLIEHVKPICTSTECREIYIEALEELASLYVQNPNGRISVKSGSTNHFLMGITLEAPKLHLGVRINQSKIQIHYHCPDRLQWMKCSKNLEYRSEFGVAITEDNLFLVGGIHSKLSLNTVVCLNLKTMNVTEVNPMAEYRGWCRAAVLNGFLYAVGGRNEKGSDLKSVEKWNQKTNTWSTVASMLVNRCNFGLAVLNEKLYAVGGLSGGNGVVAAAECYDVHQNKWISVASMHHPRQALSVAVSNGLLYAVGGAGNIKTVERYNPEFNSWTMLSNINENLVGSCTSFRNKIIGCYKDHVGEYNEETNEWKACTSLKVLKNSCRIFTYSGELLTSEFVET